MKKTFLILMTKLLFLLIFCVSLLSCGKNEIYNPEQKIKRIYESWYDNPKFLIQEWTWDNDKLMKIDYSGYNTEYYTYEDSKLVKVQDKDGYFKISYKNKKYDRIEYYKENKNSVLATWDFSYLNNKISSVTIKCDDIRDFYESNMEKGGFLSSLMPISMIKNSAKDDDYVPLSVEMKYSYKYKGDNIKEMKVTSTEMEDYYRICSYESHDKMLNPFFKHIGLENSNFVPFNRIVTSKNNPLKIIEYYTINPGAAIITEYSYQYNNDMFPIEVVVLEYSPYEYEQFGEAKQYKRYYEYE